VPELNAVWADGQVVKSPAIHVGVAISLRQGGLVAPALPHQLAQALAVRVVQPDVSFREQLDIDSMDFLNFVIGLHKELHVDIPEKDYPKLSTLQGCMEYLISLQDVQCRE